MPTIALIKTICNFKIWAEVTPFNLYLHLWVLPVMCHSIVMQTKWEVKRNHTKMIGNLLLGCCHQNGAPIRTFRLNMFIKQVTKIYGIPMSNRGENTDSNKLITVFNKNKHGFRYIIRFYLISWKDISSGVTTGH